MDMDAGVMCLSILFLNHVGVLPVKQGITNPWVLDVFVSGSEVFGNRPS